jgi:hypothetical protein
MADYGATLKAGMDEPHRLFQMKVCILKLFLLTGQGQYARSLICDLLIQSHQFSTDHAVWKLSRVDPNTLNEESGEISLSFLARLTGNTGLETGGHAVPTRQVIFGGRPSHAGHRSDQHDPQANQEV